MRAPWCKVGLDHPKSLTSAPAQMSRRAVIAAATSMLAAGCALAACSSDPEPVAVLADPEPDAVGADPKPETAPVLALHADTEIGNLLDSGPDLVVAGERVNVGLLKRFYARHGFEPVWATRQAPANSLMNAVLRAGDQGLDPDLFHADLLQHIVVLSPLDRELLLSDAFLSYADALARGAVPVERRRDDETLTPEPIDVAAVLDAAIDNPDPGATIEALAPATPTYRALRQALQKYRSAASAGDKAAMNRVRTIEVNLERQRWLPRPLPADRAWVNVADERLVLYRADQPVFSTRIVVGEDVQRNQSPEFRATIDASFFNPPWVIPSDIVAREILPKISRDPDYLTRNNMVMLAGGEAEQLPGPDAGLGLIMFDMPNRFDVYLHDTPDRVYLQPRQPSHQPWMHPGTGSARIGRPAPARTDRCDQSRDRPRDCHGQHHTAQPADAGAGVRGLPDRVCRYRRDACNFARISTSATRGSGSSCRDALKGEIPRRWPIIARHRPGPSKARSLQAAL